MLIDGISLIEYCSNRIDVCTTGAFTPSLSAILPIMNPGNWRASWFFFISSSCSLSRLSKCSRRHHKIGMLIIILQCSVWQLDCKNTDAWHVLMEWLRQSYAPGSHERKFSQVVPWFRFVGDYIAISKQLLLTNHVSDRSI